MSKEEFLEIDGIVKKIRPDTTFIVQLENGHELSCQPKGSIKMSKTRILPNDKVKVEISLYDLSKGRIIYRYPSS